MPRGSMQRCEWSFSTGIFQSNPANPFHTIPEAGSPNDFHLSNDSNDNFFRIAWAFPI